MAELQIKEVQEFLSEELQTLKKNFSTERAFGFSTFLGFIVALLLRFLGLINDNIFAISVILLVISIIMLMRERNVEEFGV